MAAVGGVDQIEVRSCGFLDPQWRYARKLWIEDLLRDVVYLPFEQPNGKLARQRRGKDTPMHSVYQDEATREQELVLDLDEIVRQGARKMLALALQAEVDAYLKAAEGERDERGRALVVKNGYARSRQIVCGAGAIEVRAPRVNDKRLVKQYHPDINKTPEAAEYMKRINRAYAIATGKERVPQ